MITINKIEIALGGAVLILLMILGIHYVRSDSLGVQTLSSEREFNRAISDSLSLEAKILNIRQLEKQFLLTRTIAHAAEFDAAITDLSHSVINFNQQYQDQDMSPILDNIAAYNKAVMNLITLHKTLGLDQNSGLEGSLRQAAHNAESIFSRLNDHEMLAHLMYSRRHEKDYMMRLEPKYIDRFHDRIDAMLRILDSGRFSEADTENIRTNLTIYRRDFGLWSFDRQLIAQDLKSVDYSYEQLVSQVKTLVLRLVATANKLAVKGTEMRKWSNFALILIGMLSIAAAILLVSMVLRHRRLTLTVEKLANKDALTNLPNRRRFTHQLEQMIKENSSAKIPIAVGIIDLDGFKAINDIYGHAAGDQLLTKAGERLRNILPKDISLARLGGDEFGMILYSEKHVSDIKKIGQSVCEVLRKPFSLKEGIARIAGSVGFAISNNNEDAPATLFEHADYALYHAKENMKGEPVIFSSEHEKCIREGREIEQTLHEADLENELCVVFQPIVDTVEGCTVGMEALARWISPTLGFVRPDIFIKAAEQTGIISRLTPILMKKALKAASTWPKDTYLSFNLSVMDIASPEAALKIVSNIMDSGFPPNRIIFEITETSMMLNFNRANETLNSFRAMGIRIALDDFGTGYSSLGYIQKMPIDRLKVDRAFISDIETNKTTRNIMQSIVNLCDNLEISCVVEGVEDHRQLEIIEGLGCRYVQGYYYSRPLEETSALEFLTSDTSDTLNDWRTSA